MCLIGCDAPGRNIEQHDIFFGIGDEPKDIVPQVKSFWPDAIKPHLDAWREVTRVGSYFIRVVGSSESRNNDALGMNLYFLNLGGYKQNEFEEFHYRMLVVAKDKGDAIQQGKQTAFFKHTGFKGATSHVDDKYGVDVDDVLDIKEILPKDLTERYSIIVELADQEQPGDEIHLGFYLLDKL
jgi:hypothetical protein